MLWSKILILIIVIIICVIIVLIFDQSSLFPNEITKFTFDVAKESENSIIHHLQDGIHLAIVCANQKFNEIALTTIKSIMFHHRKSYILTFHIFTDAHGKQLINTYFSSMINVCTQFRIYSIDNLMKVGEQFLKKHRITVSHYSGIYAFSKALIHDLLPSDVQHVIVIDTDVIFVDDVYSIWKQFDLFKRNQTALGLVPWYPLVPIDYKYKASAPDPFLTGIVLLDLNICRRIDFTQLLDKVVDIAYQQFQLRSLWSADQVVLNLFATYFPDYFISLPCFVNGHTFHYLLDGSRWKSSCQGKYPRTLHVVPSNNLLNKSSYFGHWYATFNEMPIEWLSYCNLDQLRIENRTNI
ncbi:unnamed protein product [Adineta steineri]|uniref:Glycosyltransferase-like protein n=1 Tax=Adineta steineri TaxID=433720 RepID=A0A818VNE6_9BILA|nr:unnamed protein product [Adineta steineri]